MGKPLNLASRLQAIAEPGTVVIAEGTRRLVGELFVARRPGPSPSQGLHRTGAGLAGGRRRFGREPLRGAAGASLTPLVGRRQELTLLLDRWEQAKEGEGQVVLLSGEPGIGKSRLVRALRERLAEEPHIAS